MNTFKLTDSQQETVEANDNNILGIVVVSGSTVVIGKSEDADGGSIFIHTDETAEPLYMGLQEARILAALLTVAVG